MRGASPVRGELSRPGSCMTVLSIHAAPHERTRVKQRSDYPIPGRPAQPPWPHRHLQSAIEQEHDLRRGRSADHGRPTALRPGILRTIWASSGWAGGLTMPEPYAVAWRAGRRMTELCGAVASPKLPERIQLRRGACPKSDALFAGAVLLPIPSRLTEEQEKAAANAICEAVSPHAER